MKETGSQAVPDGECNSEVSREMGWFRSVFCLGSVVYGEEWDVKLVLLPKQQEKTHMVTDRKAYFFM